MPFLPRLLSLSLSWDGQDQVTANLASVLSGPALRRLEISVCTSYHAGIEEQYFKDLVRGFTKASPSLHHIQLAFDRDPTNSVTDHIPHLVRYMSDLRTFKCRLAPGLAIVYLARLPQLIELSIPLPRSLKDGTILTKYTSTPFPKLQYLHCRSAEISRIMTFLPYVQSTALSKVTLTADARKSTLAELADYLELLSTRESIKDIVVQKLARPSEYQTPADASVLKFSTISPLLQLRNVTTLAISAGFAVDLYDDCIRVMAERWPNLSRLSILSERPLRRRSKISMDALLILLQNCHSLDSLGLTFDPSPFSDETRETVAALRLSKPDIGCSLFKLSVLNCDFVYDTAAVASSLHAMFPEFHLAVEDPETQDPEEARRIESWKEVRKLVRQLRRERRWGQVNVMD